MGSRLQTDPKLRIWRQFLEAHTLLVRRMDQDLQNGKGLPLDWYDVLVQLQEAGGRRTMGNLADALLISPSNCSRLVDRLTAEGLVTRQSDDSDGRVKHAVLTDAGFQRLKDATPIHLDSIERYFTHFLADEDLDTVRRLFASILDAVDGPAEGVNTGDVDRT